jgi:hypothetical protein
MIFVSATLGHFYRGNRGSNLAATLGDFLGGNRQKPL